MQHHNKWFHSVTPPTPTPQPQPRQLQPPDPNLYRFLSVPNYRLLYGSPTSIIKLPLLCFWFPYCENSIAGTVSCAPALILKVEKPFFGYVVKESFLGSSSAEGMVW